MFRAKIGLNPSSLYRAATAGSGVLLLAATAFAADFSGASAFKYTQAAVQFGPRPSGSAANRQLQAYIRAQLRLLKCEVIEDPFTAKTLKGDIPMTNIIAKFPGKSGKAIVVSGHFDTKLYPGRKFVGANDGGSSTGLLLELARDLSGTPRIDDIYVVFFDGEEALAEWTETDSVYGSRHLAYKWKADGALARIKALINVDMIGDKSLDILLDENSTPSLRKLVWSTAAELGYKAYFLDTPEKMEDDHMPFLKLGVPSLDLIDFDYDPWHKDSDTMDKLSPKSLDIVGTVVLESVHKLERQ
ncbi:MAG TPA: M28 family peptidase [Bryobacteraceae bacterium]|jgi:glutaminyl-peptide cyclotransferase|nr:M28 family peptidase [Bryobacteraceae bacterium]